MLTVANAISMIGNVMALVSVPWFVLQTTGSASQTGISAFFTVLPIAVAAFLGGSLVDKLGYKRTSIIADLASCVAIGLIPLIYALGGLEFWVLLALVFFGNLLDAPGTTARAAMLPDLAALADWPIERVASLSQGVERSSRLIGAPLAGVLIALLGSSQILWIDAATFAVSALLVLLFVPKVAPGIDSESTQNWLGSLTSGLTFIWRNRLLKVIVLVVMVTNLLDAAFGSVIYPVYVNRFFGDPLVLGLSIAVSGGGAVVGAIWFAVWGHKLSYKVLIVGGFVIAGLRFGVLALGPPLWGVLLTFLITGLAVGPINPIIVALEFRVIPPAQRGRVLGAVVAGVTIAVPLGVLAAGFLLEQLDIHLVLGLLSILYLAAIANLLFVNFDEPPSHPNS